MLPTAWANKLPTLVCPAWAKTGDLSGRVTSLVGEAWIIRGKVFIDFKRITINPAVCGGKPCIRGLRFPVSRLLGLLATGETSATILNSYPYLEEEDIQEALGYAAKL